jgi:hypothetical protein
VRFAAITLCAASQRVFIVVYFVIDSVRKLLDTPLYLMGLALNTSSLVDVEVMLPWFGIHNLVCKIVVETGSVVRNAFWSFCKLLALYM